MSRVTLKSSTIFISVGNKTEVYRSVADVPPSLRKKLEQSTNGINSATILIADRKGKEEIVRAIRGLPSNLRSKLSTSLREDAARAVRIDLALRALAREENLEPTEDEIDEELTTTAESMNVSADLLRSNLRDTGRVVTFRSEVAKMKASRWLNENVTFIDPEGVEIDPSLLKAEEAVEPAESDDVDA